MPVLTGWMKPSLADYEIGGHVFKHLVWHFRKRVAIVAGHRIGLHVVESNKRVGRTINQLNPTKNSISAIGEYLTFEPYRIDAFVLTPLRIRSGQSRYRKGKSAEYLFHPSEPHLNYHVLTIDCMYGEPMEYLPE